MIQSISNDIPFAKIALGFDACTKWIESLGLPIKSSRLRRYAQALDELKAAFEARDPERLRRQDADYSNSLYEAYELIGIYKSLHLAQVKGIEPNLRRLLSGPDWRRSETASNGSIHARNTAVELFSAALLVQGGYSVEFPGDAEDVVATSQAGRLSVECKRPSSSTKVFKRIKEALEQCNQRVSKSGLSDHCGLVVIDASWVSNPNFDFLPFPDTNVAAKELRIILAKGCADIKRNVSMEDHKFVLGILVRFSALVEDRSVRNLVYTDHCHFIANQAIDNDKLPIGEDFVRRLQAARQGY